MAWQWKQVYKIDTRVHILTFTQHIQTNNAIFDSCLVLKIFLCLLHACLYYN